MTDDNKYVWDADDRDALESRVKDALTEVFKDTPFLAEDAILNDCVIIVGWANIGMDMQPTMFRAGSMHGTQGLIDFAYRVSSEQTRHAVRLMMEEGDSDG